MRLQHTVHTRANPAQVWQLLGVPGRWPQFEPLVHRVRGGAATAATGGRLVAVSRAFSVQIPVDVLEAVPEQRLVLLVHTAPGVREQVTFEIAAALRGGSDLRASVVVEGPLARLAVAPLWLACGLTVRVLAAQAERTGRAGPRDGQGAA